MEAVGRTAEQINEEYGTGSWRPIELFLEDNFPRSVAAYKNYDALLVNAVRDGMNLVAKEAAIVNERSGVLVLSENARSEEHTSELQSRQYLVCRLLLEKKKKKLKSTHTIQRDNSS